MIIDKPKLRTAQVRVLTLLERATGPLSKYRMRERLQMGDELNSVLGKRSRAAKEGAVTRAELITTKKRAYDLGWGVGKEGRPCDNPYSEGDEEMRDAWEAGWRKGDETKNPSLLTLGYISIKTLDIEGLKEDVYCITELGRAVLLDHVVYDPEPTSSVRIEPVQTRKWAYDAGWRAGRGGKSAESNPYESGDEFYEAWFKGHAKGSSNSGQSDNTEETHGSIPVALARGRVTPASTRTP